MSEELKTLHIDDKWSIKYKPNSNDAPYSVERYGELAGKFRYDNVVVAMFYALLRERGSNDS